MKSSSIINTAEYKTKKSNCANRTEKRKAKEVKARRKVNEAWQRVEVTGKYRIAAAKKIGMNITQKIAVEVLDGILLNFHDRNNNDKTQSKQKRLLRRIVEKRQSQAIHAKTRNNRDRILTVAVITNTSECMEHLYNLRFA